MSQSSPSAGDLNGDEEISLIDVLRFLKNTYKTILVFGLAGTAIAVAYLAITPKKFEATAQIVMAQIGAVNSSLNPLGVNIEEPALLSARLAIPTSYTPVEIAACGFEGESNAAASLVKAITLVPAKGIPYVVELKILGSSPESVKGCANAIFDLIKKTQAQIIAPYIKDAQIKLANEERRLSQAQALVSKSDKAGSIMGATYLSTRDEIRYLLENMTGLKNIIASDQNRSTRLLAPIYASSVPISPKKNVALASGLLAGLFLGLLIALARQKISRVKGEEGGSL